MFSISNLILVLLFIPAAMIVIPLMILVVRMVCICLHGLWTITKMLVLWKTHPK